VHHKGGLPWLCRQFEEAKAGCNSPVNTAVELFCALPDSPNDVYMVGDSLIARAMWSELLGSPDVRNRGIAGNTTADVLDRLDEVVSGKPRIVLLMVGVNDLQRGWSVADTVARYREIVTRIRAESPRTRIAVHSVLPVNEYLYHQYITPMHPEARMPTLVDVQAINDGIRDLGDVYIDLWPGLVVDGQLRPDCTNDGLHVNYAGYCVWRDGIKSLLC